MISARLTSLTRLFTVCALVIAAAGCVYAQSNTFANFSDDGQNPFVFTNTGSTSSFTSSAIPVNFYYNTANGLGPAGQEIPATLVITGTVNAPATSVGAIDYQTFSSLSLGFYDAAGDNLLTVNDTPLLGSFPTLAGNDGSGSATVSASSAGRGKEDVSYTSSFLNFSSVTNENYGLSFSSIDDTSGPDAGSSGITFDQNLYLDSFIASGTGTFASTPAPLPTSPNSVPEPNPAIILLMGVCSLTLIGFYRRTSFFPAR